MNVDLERVVEATLDFYKRDPDLTPAEIARFLRIVIQFQSCDEGAEE